jgi:hypothetical protein
MTRPISPANPMSSTATAAVIALPGAKVGSPSGVVGTAASNAPVPPATQ